MSSVSAIPSITSGLSASSSTASKLPAQSDKALQALSTAIQSGDRSAATAALTAIQTAFTASNKTSTLTSNNVQVQGDLDTMSQVLGSGNTKAINIAFAALKKDLTAPASPASSSTSEITPAYVLTLLSTLPGTTSSTGTTDVGFNLLSAISAQSTAMTKAVL